ncbi:hypothetical protein Ciccas_001640 [Cichlidogyrus casuarinus]|uniref:Phosphoribosyltransferase domain-containing protein n=1 Tax=Cichlidogyrus casuarinus TaxID=1844966 RepID=A0ABD2QKJ1_9PLAT
MSNSLEISCDMLNNLSVENLDNNVSSPDEAIHLSDDIIVIERTQSVLELLSILRDKLYHSFAHKYLRNTDRVSFIFNADRLIRLIIEEGLNQLPEEEVQVQTPTGEMFRGYKFTKGNCGVSVIRSGEAMERSLRQCCRNFRIGKILIEPADEVERNSARIIYAKLPSFMESRRVLLMYPILNSATVIIEAIKVLQEYQVKMDNVIILTLTSCPSAIKCVLEYAKGVRIVTSEINSLPFNDFAKKYFGTE